MTQIDPILTTPERLDVAGVRSESTTFAWADLGIFCKTGIVKLVTVTSGVGFVMAALGRNWDVLDLVIKASACLIGTALTAAGANALNQVMEARRDGLMKRTQSRPLPTGKLSVAAGTLIGLAISLLGLGVLCVGATPWASLVSAVTIATYLLWYTPLKTVTPLATIVGAVPGALPPLVGWAAASSGPWGGLTELGGWTLFAFMFVWQIPHFLALAWKYRHDYAAGGYPVLPAVDPGGERTAWVTLTWSIALIPVSLSPVAAMPQLLGVLYISVAVLAGAWFLWAAIKMARLRTDHSARAVFLASIAYLPLVMLTMVADALLHRL